MDKYTLIKYMGVGKVVEFLQQKEIGFIHDIPTSENRHFKYIEGYFNEINVKTLIFEMRYIDKDYLEDYSNYYSRCYNDYPKRCIRLHCFEEEFSDTQFKEFLSSNKGDDFLNKSYLGFIVFRPLPLTLFGRTCLKTYPEEDIRKPTFRRKYNILRDYEVNLYGISLKIKSLAYQEQDMAVAACATSALWSAFQGTGSIFHHHFPTPYEITLNATKHIVFTDRSFPNKGLMIQQMASAIRAVNLEPLLMNYVLHSYFKAHLRAFLKGGIPVILSLELKDIPERPNSKSNLEDLPGKKFYHAVLVTGYGIREDGVKEFQLLPDESNKYQKKNKNTELQKFYLKSSKLEKIYVHDDQIGPFAVMEFIKSDEDFMTTSWAEFAPDQYTNVIAKPTALLIPLYHKIRIPFVKIRTIIYEFDTQVLTILNKDVLKLEGKELGRFEWDIYINTITDLKKNIRNQKDIEHGRKFDFLIRDFPKYIWVADAYLKNEKAFTFIFDATDVENGKLFICALHYGNRFEYIHAFAISENYEHQTYQSKVILDEYKIENYPNIYH